MRQLNGNIINKGLIDLDPNANKLLSNGDQKRLTNENSQRNEKDPSNATKAKPNQPIKLTNENKNDSQLNQLLIKMERGSENQSAQSILANLAGQTQLNQQQQFNLQQNFINHPHPLNQPSSELSIEQLNQLYYYYYPYYYLYKLNENSGKTLV